MIGLCMRYLILLALAAVLLFSGCVQTPTTPTVTCPANYMKIANDCCLDAKGNGICDRDELIQPSCPEQNTTICNCPNCPEQNKTIEDRVNDCNHGTSTDNCLTRLAVETNNPAICAGVSTYPYLNTDHGREYCYMQLAVRYQNRAYCELINDFPSPLIRADCETKLANATK